MKKQNQENQNPKKSLFDIEYDRINELRHKYAKQYGVSIKTQYQEEESTPHLNIPELVKKFRNKYEEETPIPKNNIYQFSHKVRKIDLQIDDKLNHLQNKLKSLQRQPSPKKTLQEHCFNLQTLNSEVVENKKVVVDEIPTQNIQIEIKDKEKSVELLGNFKKGTEYTKEYIAFIHHLKDQIDIDNQFTRYLSTIPKSQLERIKLYLKEKYKDIDIEYFDVSSMEIDPLSKPKVQETKNEKVMAEKLYLAYSEIQNHYRQKLYKNYAIQTIQTLIGELGEGQLSLGHLISYINMRTGKEFRNRFLIKMLRRLKMRNHSIDPRQLYIHFTR